MIENKSDELANFMSTPDLRQCRAVKNVNLKIVGYDKNDEKNEVQMMRIKACNNTIDILVCVNDSTPSPHIYYTYQGIAHVAELHDSF